MNRKVLLNLPLEPASDDAESTIFSRGYDYFLDGRVSKPTKNGDIFKSKVDGGRRYTVEVTIENYGVTNWSCNCPYDGGLCKHVIALIYYIQEEDLLQVRDEPISKKKKHRDEKIEFLLKKLEFSELTEFLFEALEKHPEVKTAFLKKFDTSVRVERPKYYEKKADALISGYADENNAIDEDTAEYLYQQLDNLIEEADFLLKTNNFFGGINYCFGLLRALAKNDEVYFSEEGVVTLSIMEPLGPLLKQNVTTFPKDVKEYLFNLTLSFIRQKEDRADLWRKDLIELAKKLTDSKEKAEILIDTLLSLYDRNSWIDDVMQELFELISKWKTADELDKFIDSHLDSDYIRKTAIDRELMLKNYSGAVAMIKEKITGSSDYDFYLTSWYEMLLAIAQQINDENTILQCAKYLLIHTHNNDKDYFDLIRKYTAPSKLNNTIDGIIKEINSNFDKRKAYNIYIYGEMWNKLMDYVKKSESLSELLFYHKYLLKDYPGEILILFIYYLREFAKDNMGGDNYDLICNSLRAMIGFGATNEAAMLKEEFLIEYKRRLTLVSRLKKIIL